MICLRKKRLGFEFLFKVYGLEFLIFIFSGFALFLGFRTRRGGVGCRVELVE